MNRSGLKKVTRMVKGRKGSVRRSYWVKSDQDLEKKPGFLARHGKKILRVAGKVALVGAGVGAAYLAHKHMKKFGDRKFSEATAKFRQSVLAERRKAAPQAKPTQQYAPHAPPPLLHNPHAVNPFHGEAPMHNGVRASTHEEVKAHRDALKERSRRDAEARTTAKMKERLVKSGGRRF